MSKETEPSPMILPSPPSGGAMLPAREKLPLLRTGRRAPVRLIAVVLAVLVALVVLSSLLLHFNIPTNMGPSGQPSLNTGAPGAFAGSPYSASQINALQHLVDRMTFKVLAGLYVAHMTLDEKLGQLIMTESEQNNYSDDLNYMITQLHVGGMIMYESHLQTAAQARNTTSQAQKNAKIPLLISVDEEGGLYVHRLEHIYGSRPGPWEIYQSGSLDFARQQGAKMAHDLLTLGLNTDLAPDVDVMIISGYDTVDRTFGTTADSVIHYAGPYMAAMQGNGLIACMKHYPGGLGDTPYDAHAVLPSDSRTRDQIYATELAPYKAYINNPDPLMRPSMIMSTDVLMPAIDAHMPAELSHIFMTDILRTQMGFDGVALTDALYMGGISAHWSEPQAAVLAIAAGNDMILSPMGSARTLAVIDALKQALGNGQLTMARVNEAVTRIIALKMQYHMIPVVLPR